MSSIKNSRNIKYIVVHCTATPQNTTIASMKKYWKEVKKWGDTPGYHFIIKPNGVIEQLLPITKNSYGVYAHNDETISIAYIGGIDKKGQPLDNRTEAQNESLFYKIVELLEKFDQAEVLGHRDFKGVKKACPSFDVKSWLRNFVPEVITHHGLTNNDTIDLDDLSDAFDDNGGTSFSASDFNNSDLA
jgi:N-acetylmuramoyl-L-alanine amidase